MTTSDHTRLHTSRSSTELASADMALLQEHGWAHPDGDPDWNAVALRILKDNLAERAAAVKAHFAVGIDPQHVDEG